MRTVRSYRRESRAPEITVAAELEGASRGPSLTRVCLPLALRVSESPTFPAEIQVPVYFRKKDNFAWLYTEDFRDEYKEVLKRLRVRPHLIGRVVNPIRDRAKEVRLHISMEISSDPKDDSFCLCANESKAHSIVT